LSTTDRLEGKSFIYEAPTFAQQYALLPAPDIAEDGRETVDAAANDGAV
jgi:hypothetical protein